MKKEHLSLSLKFAVLSKYNLFTQTQIALPDGYAKNCNGNWWKLALMFLSVLICTK